MDIVLNRAQQGSTGLMLPASNMGNGVCHDLSNRLAHLVLISLSAGPVLVMSQRKVNSFRVSED